MLSPESFEETIGDRRDFERDSTYDHSWQGPSRPPSVVSGHDSPTAEELHRLAITGPVASGEYYETWPDDEPDDEPGFTQPAQDPPTPTQDELPVGGDGNGGGALAVQVFRKRLTKEDTLMSIDFSQPQESTQSTESARKWPSLFRGYPCRR